MRELGGQADRLSGQVRIGAPDGCAELLLLDACDALSRDNPDLELQIVALPRVVNLSRARPIWRSPSRRRAPGG